MRDLKVWIPVCPPGLNETYIIGKNRKTGKGWLYKSEEANDWSAKAALIVGFEAAQQGWADESRYYEISIKFSNFRQDVDASVKLVIDVVSQKLGFNDKRIMKQCSEKVKLHEEGVLIELKHYQE